MLRTQLKQMDDILIHPLLWIPILQVNIFYVNECIVTGRCSSENRNRRYHHNKDKPGKLSRCSLHALGMRLVYGAVVVGIILGDLENK
jgi:hypothetical protein